MPANMMNAWVGSSVYVSGSSSAMVIAGPMPGSTPIAVPSSTPRNAYSRLIGVSAVANPSMRELIPSIRGFPSGARPGSLMPRPA